MYAGLLCSYYIFLIGIACCIYYRFIKRIHALLTIPVALIGVHVIAHVLDRLATDVPIGGNQAILTFLTQPGIFALPASIVGSITAGLFMGANRNRFCAVILICSITLTFVFRSKQWFDQWIFYLNYHTNDGMVQQSEPKWVAIDSLGREISDRSFDNKTVVVDFWNTACGVCYMKFPLLDSIQAAYRDDTTLIFYAINIPADGDSAQKAFGDIQKRGYHFNVALGDSTMPAAFGFNSFPSVIILRNDSIVYRGNIEKAVSYLSASK